MDESSVSGSQVILAAVTCPSSAIRFCQSTPTISLWNQPMEVSYQPLKQVGFLVRPAQPSVDGLTCCPQALLPAAPAVDRFKMLMAALTSRSWTVSQIGHCHMRTFSSITSIFVPQTEQVFEEGYQRLIFSTRQPYHAPLYPNMVTNADHPASPMDFAR